MREPAHWAQHSAQMLIHHWVRNMLDDQLVDACRTHDLVHHRIEGPHTASNPLQWLAGAMEWMARLFMSEEGVVRRPVGALEVAASSSMIRFLD